MNNVDKTAITVNAFQKMFPSLARTVASSSKENDDGTTVLLTTTAGVDVVFTYRCKGFWSLETKAHYETRDRNSLLNED